MQKLLLSLLLLILLTGCSLPNYKHEERYVNAPAKKATEQINKLCKQGFKVDDNGVDYHHQSEDGSKTYHLWESARLTKETPLTNQQN